MTVTNDADITREIATLESSDRTVLLERWQSAFGCPAPARISRALLVKSIAHHIQVKAYGGLSKHTVRALKAAIKPNSPSSKPPACGARLVREWNGVLHEVEVREDGYLWREEHYRSLSAIALAITGSKWSGPRFFGIRAN